MTANRVTVVEKIMNANDHMADLNKQRLDHAGVLSANLMASPGSGKTSFILKTIEALASRLSNRGCRGRYCSCHDRRR